MAGASLRPETQQINTSLVAQGDKYTYFSAEGGQRPDTMLEGLRGRQARRIVRPATGAG